MGFIHDVIGDTKVHNSLCGKYNCQNINIRFLCWHCDCPTEFIVDPDVVAKANLFIPKTWIQIVQLIFLNISNLSLTIQFNFFS